jgi:CheY-like chemotaxis protein/HPt (histidine-containing phosphotransfer) domain-containing protein
MFSNTLNTLGFPAPASKPKVLFVIGDSVAGVESMCRAFTPVSFHFKALAAAEVTVEMLDEARPSLILVDPQALDANGTPLARRLLLDERLLDIPIVALLVNESSQNAFENRPSEEYGCFDGYIAMLAQGENPAGRIQALLDNPKEPSSIDLAAIKRRALEEGAPRGFPYIIKRAEQLRAAKTVRSRHRFASAIRFCLDLLNRDPDSNAEMGGLRVAYLRRRRTELESLRRAVPSEDWHALATAGHNMKGTGAGYGFAELTDLGRHLETAARGRDLLAVEGLLQRIEAYIGLIQPSLGAT